MRCCVCYFKRHSKFITKKAIFSAVKKVHFKKYTRCNANWQDLGFSCVIIKPVANVVEYLMYANFVEILVFYDQKSDKKPKLKKFPVI